MKIRYKPEVYAPGIKLTATVTLERTAIINYQRLADDPDTLSNVKYELAKQILTELEADLIQPLSLERMATELAKADLNLDK